MKPVIIMLTFTANFRDNQGSEKPANSFQVLITIFIIYTEQDCPFLCI